MKFEMTRYRGIGTSSQKVQLATELISELLFAWRAIASYTFPYFPNNFDNRPIFRCGNTVGRIVVYRTSYPIRLTVGTDFLNYTNNRSEGMKGTVTARMEGF